MSKQEAKFKAEGKRHAKILIPGFYIFYVRGVGTDGIPDWSANGYGHSSWLEWKHSINGVFSTQDNQELACCRLAATSRCRYVVFDERGTTKRICIIDPKHVIGKHGKLAGMIIETQIPEFDYRALCEWLRDYHR